MGFASPLFILGIAGGAAADTPTGGHGYIVERLRRIKQRHADRVPPWAVRGQSVHGGASFGSR